MYCIKCGKKIVDDANFCLYCGNKVEQAREIEENGHSNKNLDRTVKEEVNAKEKKYDDLFDGEIKAVLLNKEDYSQKKLEKTYAWLKVNGFDKYAKEIDLYLNRGKYARYEDLQNDEIKTILLHKEDYSRERLKKAYGWLKVNNYQQYAKEIEMYLGSQFQDVNIVYTSKEKSSAPASEANGVTRKIILFVVSSLIVAFLAFSIFYPTISLDAYLVEKRFSTVEAVRGFDTLTDIMDYFMIEYTDINDFKGYIDIMLLEGIGVGIGGICCFYFGLCRKKDEYTFCVRLTSFLAILYSILTVIFKVYINNIVEMNLAKIPVITWVILVAGILNCLIATEYKKQK